MNTYSSEYQHLQKSVLIIDANVEEQQLLANGAVDGAEVFILDADRDGVEQVTNILCSVVRPNSSTAVSLHIIAHGSPGTLYLGNSELSLDTLNRYTGQLQAWNINHLLLYGCNVAAGDAGEEFLTKLNALTNAPIAASSTPVGHAELGGNWQLDSTTHDQPVELAIDSNAALSYKNILAISGFSLSPTSSTSSVDASLTNNPLPEFIGTDTPGNTVEILINNVVIGQTTVAADGSWTVTPTTPLVDGSYQVTARSTDPLNVAAPMTAALAITVDTIGGTGAIAALAQPIRDTAVDGITIEFSEQILQLDSNRLTLTRDGVAVSLDAATLTTTDSITWQLSNISDVTANSGSYQLSLVENSITDLAGNTLTAVTGIEWVTGFTADPIERAEAGNDLSQPSSLGSDDHDALRGDRQNNFLHGLEGHDNLRGYQGRDKLIGGIGHDRQRGGLGNDVLAGRKGNDVLLGGRGDDILRGDQGNDVLKGGGGNDLLIGHQGRDIMFGGRGADTFLFRQVVAEGDLIRGFTPGQDVIDLSNIFSQAAFSGDNPFAQFVSHIELVQIGANTDVRIDFDGNGAGTETITLVTLAQVDATDLSSENFLIG
ncbi:MAG: DUF4347 domain-containing protein [Merismopedia sp. SIO2A8]|nr:DUF4347 domain-containing protein [Merismopedia sp. SIO2A8]